MNVFLNDCCSVIATNPWNEEEEKLTVSEQDWLAANAVVFDVIRPLWEAAEEPRAEALPSQ